MFTCMRRRNKKAKSKPLRLAFVFWVRHPRPGITRLKGGLSRRVIGGMFTCMRRRNKKAKSKPLRLAFVFWVRHPRPGITRPKGGLSRTAAELAPAEAGNKKKPALADRLSVL